MASTLVQPSPPMPESLLATSRTLALGLVWGGCMLFILGWWLGIKHEDLSRLVVFLVWILALGSFSCGIWQYLALARSAAALEEKRAAIIKQRQLLSVVLVAGGLILMGLGLY